MALIGMPEPAQSSQPLNRGNLMKYVAPSAEELARRGITPEGKKAEPEVKPKVKAKAKKSKGK